MSLVSGHKLGLQLVKALGLPNNVRSFTLRCEIGKAPTVELVTYVREEDADAFVEVLTKYDIEERPEP